jgi:hypothetical protein
MLAVVQSKDVCSNGIGFLAWRKVAESAINALEKLRVAEEVCHRQNEHGSEVVVQSVS